MMTLSELLRDSNYRLTQFNIADIINLENRIQMRSDSKGSPVPYVKCLVRKIDIR